MAGYTQAESDENAHYLRIWLNVCIAFLVLDTFFVALRLASRRIGSKADWGMDDFMIAPAWASNVIFISLSIYAIARDQATLTATSKESYLAALSDSLRGIYGVQMVYIPAYTFPKLSLLFMFLRIFPQRHMRRIIWGLIIFVVIDLIAYIIPAIVICVPPNAFWNFTVHGKCIDNDAYNRSVPLPNILTDIAMLLLPIPATMKLNASLGKRVGILLTFATGSIGTIVAIVRWAFFLKYSVHSSALSITSKLDILGVVEPSTYLIAACLPPLRSFAVRAGPQWFAQSISKVFRSERSDSHSQLRGGKSTEAVAPPSSDSPTDNTAKRISQFESNMEKGMQAEHAAR